MEHKNSKIEEKRGRLAEKLDADLDSFMDELAAKSARNRRQKPFDFEEWCHEIDKHPAFMKELKKSGEEGESAEYSAEVQAIQALKYDEDNPVECAIAYKKDGNRYFKLGKYRRAIGAYTKGIRLNCPDVQLNSILYANRAAANKHLGNLRSAIRDCTSARRLLPDNFKAIFRGAECLLELGRTTLCSEWIEQSSELFSKFDEEQQQKLTELKENAQQRRLIEERDQRRQRVMERKAKTQTGSSLSDIVTG